MSGLWDEVFGERAGAVALEYSCFIETCVYTKADGIAISELQEKRGLECCDYN